MQHIHIERREREKTYRHFENVQNPCKIKRIEAEIPKIKLKNIKKLKLHKIFL